MIRMKGIFPAILILSAATVPVIAATPADLVKTRVDGFKALGGAFKKLNDTLRGDADLATLKASAADIEKASKWQYKWFPKGTGAGTPDLKTSAKPEIWSNPVGFKTAQDNFANQAAALKKAADSGNVDAIRAEARKLGGTCKGCHDNFRVPD